MKRKKKKKNAERPPLLYINFTDADLRGYSPEVCDTYEEAMDALLNDLELTAAATGYTVDQIWLYSVNEFKERIKELWDAEQKQI